MAARSSMADAMNGLRPRVRSMTTSELLAALCQPEAYPHACVTPITRRDSHISWLFFTGPYVYKIKKAVNLGFLDHTSLARRRQVCEAEVRLNQRLSPGVYLAVVPICYTAAGWRVDGAGVAQEYAVKMRQLPDDCWLTQWLMQGRATPALMRRLAHRLAAFHAIAETSAAITRLGGPATMRRNAAENFAQLADYRGVTLSAETYDLLRAYTDAFLDSAAPLLRQRAAQGRVRDCHGDLHADHVAIEGDAIEFIDCIEFNDRFRYSDVAADLAFLAMDLDYHGRPDLRQVLVDTYQAQSGDASLPVVMPYFQCYRAIVRGKVETLHQADPAVAPETRTAARQRACRYFALARAYAQPTGPLLLACHGLMGAGKSTLARALALRWSAEMLTADVVRKELVGLTPETRQLVGWGEGIYSAEHDQATYAELCRRAAAHLAQQRVVILDASFRRPQQRQMAQAVAQAAGAPFYLIDVRCSEDVLRRRLRQRQAADPAQPSDGRPDLLAEQMAHYAPPTELPATQRLTIDANQSLDKTIQCLLVNLYQRLFQNQLAPYRPAQRTGHAPDV